MPQMYQEGAVQLEYGEMEVPYPQAEMPPMEQEKGKEVELGCVQKSITSP